MDTFLANTLDPASSMISKGYLYLSNVYSKVYIGTIIHRINTSTGGHRLHCVLGLLHKSAVVKDVLMHEAHAILIDKTPVMSSYDCTVLCYPGRQLRSTSVAAATLIVSMKSHCHSVNTDCWLLRDAKVAGPIRKANNARDQNVDQSAARTG